MAVAVVKSIRDDVKSKWREHRTMVIITIIMVVVLLVLLSGVIIQIDVQVTK